MTMTISRDDRPRRLVPSVCRPRRHARPRVELDVTNPGPIQADALDDAKALTAVVNGAGRDLAEALNWIAYTGGAVAREIFPAGSTGSFGITPRQQAGKLADDDGNDWWNSVAARALDGRGCGRARASASSTRRPATASTLAQALVWAGYRESACSARTSATA